MQPIIDDYFSKVFTLPEFKPLSENFQFELFVGMLMRGELLTTNQQDNDAELKLLLLWVQEICRF